MVMSKDFRAVFECTGIVERLYFSTRSDTLTVTVGIFRPRMSKGNNWISDHPRFAFTGDRAKKLRKELKERQFVTVTGTMNNEVEMERQENGLYKRRIVTRPVVDQILPTNGSRYQSMFLVKGYVIRVNANPQEGKKFYQITAHIPADGKDGAGNDVDVIYFDQAMKLDVKVGDIVYCSGSVHTKDERVSRGRNTYYRHYANLVATNVAVTREEGEKDTNGDA